MRADRAGVALVLAGLVGSGALGAWLAMRSMQPELALRPPVVVLDLARAGRGAEPPALETVLARHAEAARRLAAAGFLVLDGQAVLAAPPGLYLAGAAVSPAGE